MKNPPATIDVGVLHNKLGYHLRVAERYMHAGKKFSKATGMTTIQYSVFSLIATNEGVSQVQIGAALDMDKPSVMTIINRLEEDELIKRKTSAQDKRTNALFLTAKGKKHYPSLEKKVTKYDNQFKQRLSPEKLEQLILLLSEISGVKKQVTGKQSQ